MNNLICNRCYDKYLYFKNKITISKKHICFLCDGNIFFYNNLDLKNKNKNKNNNNIVKEIILNKKNNNTDCALKECGDRVELFEKESIVICCKCVLKNDHLNKNNYSVVKPDIMCLMCNYSCCSRYNFHKQCFNKFNLDQSEND